MIHLVSALGNCEIALMTAARTSPLHDAYLVEHNSSLPALIGRSDLKERSDYFLSTLDLQILHLKS